MNKEEMLQIIAAHMDEIRLRFKVKHLSVFGSVARDEATADSDIDILVEYTEVPGIFRFLQLKDYLEEITGVPVDLVTEKGLKHQLRASIMAEVIRVA